MQVYRQDLLLCFGGAARRACTACLALTSEPQLLPSRNQGCSLRVVFRHYRRKTESFDHTNNNNDNKKDNKRSVLQRIKLRPSPTARICPNARGNSVSDHDLKLGLSNTNNLGIWLSQTPKQCDKRRIVVHLLCLAPQSGWQWRRSWGWRCRGRCRQLLLLLR